MVPHSVRLCAAAVACACALVSPRAAAEDFASVDVAATQALRSVINLTDCREYAGAIIEQAGVYTYTTPVASHKDTFTLRLTLTRGMHLAAIYHTHPRCNAGAETLVFSPNDVTVAKQLHVPSYIGAAYDHSVRRFDPATDKTVDYTPPGEREAFGRSSFGTLVSTL
jgi:hypothetical protein